MIRAGLLVGNNQILDYMWINTVDYTIPELILCATGAVGWVLVYVLIILETRRHKFVEIPLFVACGDIVWEFLWGFVFNDRINMGELFVWSYRAWFLVDTILFIGLWRYGYKQFDIALLRRHAKSIITGLSLAFAAIISAFVVSNLDNPMGAQTAYLLNFGISTLYIANWLRLRNRHPFSKGVAWAKMLGTLVYSIFFRLRFPEYYSILALSMVIFILDCTYLWLLYNYKEEAEVITN